ncbi:alpha/beta fold hydrolase [Streptomyces sp. SID4919]|uniref:alpha/beta fold hydrolase n=1 Tax=unclassified Streptomyces TaxID=2593676 RepID=UPI0008239CF0|nr:MULTISPECIES: alpha/beta hydrolase [unclassified Streptomyces]MYY11834.1 alpha/beta fold hydrolase [Streptomyces sp. SID4919]SCK12217.1 Pimeloyl-ACP methyl ester carboxylesterase [Streptomyces sp. AmelKG-E11A]
MSRPTHVTSGPYAPPAPARELTAVSADGAHVHVEIHGPEGAPTVVLAHGWTCSTAFWAHQVRDLRADHRVVVYDQRGHGRSPAPVTGDGYSTRALADDLTAVLEAALAPGEQALLVGHSMGGMTIIAAAGRPAVRARTAAALLLSTGSGDLAARARVLPLRAGRLRTRLTRAVLGSKAPLGPVTPLGARLLRYGTMSPGTAPDRVEVCARIVHACPRAVRHGWSQVLDSLALGAGVGKLTVPTAVVVGTADRLTPRVHAHDLVTSLPHCVGLAELTGVGHMTPVEAPEAVNNRIRDMVAAYVGHRPADDDPVPTAHPVHTAQPTRTTRQAQPTHPVPEQTESPEGATTPQADINRTGGGDDPADESTHDPIDGRDPNGASST